MVMQITVPVIPLSIISLVIKKTQQFPVAIQTQTTQQIIQLLHMQTPMALLLTLRALSGLKLSRQLKIMAAKKWNS